MRIKIEAVSLGSTSVRVHPDGKGVLKERTAGLSENVESAGNTRIHMVAADARAAIAFLCPLATNDHDAPRGRTLLEDLEAMPEALRFLCRSRSR